MTEKGLLVRTFKSQNNNKTIEIKGYCVDIYVDTNKTQYGEISMKLRLRDYPCPTCTWRGCQNKAKHEHLDRFGMVFCTLCTQHHAQLEASIAGGDIREEIKAWKLSHSHNFIWRRENVSVLFYADFKNSFKVEHKKIKPWNLKPLGSEKRGNHVGKTDGSKKYYKYLKNNHS